MFRRPKKTIQRRVFSIAPDEDDNTENENTRTDVNRSDGGSDDEKMDVDPVPHQLKERKNEKRTKDADRKVTAQKTSLLSFGDEGIANNSVITLWQIHKYLLLIFDFVCRRRR